MLLSRFSTRVLYQYGISGCKLQIRNGSQTGLYCWGALKVMNMSQTLLLLVSTLVFVSVSRAVGAKSDFEIRLLKLEMASIQIKSTQDLYVMVALSYFSCCRSNLLRKWYCYLRALIFFPVIFQKNCQEKIRWICYENYIYIIIYVVRISFLYVYLIQHIVDENK